MAKSMAYSDQYGNSYTNSYWRVVQINVGVFDRNSQVTFYGYKDQDARAANKHAIGAKSYTISGEKFDELYAAHIAIGGPNMMQLAYQIATETKDVPNPSDPDNPTSFFDGAENV